jgi:hypothetical protein
VDYDGVELHECLVRRFEVPAEVDGERELNELAYFAE